MEERQDLISRQAAIDSLEKAMCEDGFRSATELIHKTTAYDIIRHLPSAQPEMDCMLKEYGDCTYSETGCSDCALKTNIQKALKAAQPDPRSFSCGQENDMISRKVTSDA